MTYRVMATQETGEEICVQSGIAGEFQARQIAEDAYLSHEEWRGCWVEDETPPLCDDDCDLRDY